MRVQPDRHRRQTPGEQRLLYRLDHANRDIGLSLQQVFDVVGEDKLDDQIRMPPA